VVRVAVGVAEGVALPANVAVAVGVAEAVAVAVWVGVKVGVGETAGWLDVRRRSPRSLPTMPRSAHEPAAPSRLM